MLEKRFYAVPIGLDELKGVESVSITREVDGDGRWLLVAIESDKDSGSEVALKLASVLKSKAGGMRLIEFVDPLGG